MATVWGRTTFGRDDQMFTNFWSHSVDIVCPFGVYVFKSAFLINTQTPPPTTPTALASGHSSCSHKSENDFNSTHCRFVLHWNSVSTTKDRARQHHGLRDHANMTRLPERWLPRGNCNLIVSFFFFFKRKKRLVLRAHRYEPERFRLPFKPVAWPDL